MVEFFLDRCFLCTHYLKFGISETEKKKKHLTGIKISKFCRNVCGGRHLIMKGEDGEKKRKREMRESVDDVYESQNQTMSFKQQETFRNQSLKKPPEIGEISILKTECTFFHWRNPKSYE